MGEHRNNGKALIKEQLGVGKNENGTVEPLQGAALLVITELARIGHTYLKSAVPDMKANIDKGDSGITPEQYEHFKAVYEAGFDVLAHFDAMCQYLAEKAAKQPDSAE